MYQVFLIIIDHPVLVSSLQTMDPSIIVNRETAKTLVESLSKTSDYWVDKDDERMLGAAPTIYLVSISSVFYF